MNRELGDNLSTKQVIQDKRKVIKNKPGVSQALWVVPVLGAGKNLWDTLIVRKDSITKRSFTPKEQLFKTLSGLCAISSRGVVGYNSYHEKEVLDTILVISGLQLINRANYITGVYYSGELQKVLQQHKENILKNAEFIKRTAQDTSTQVKQTLEKTKILLKKGRNLKKGDSENNL